MASDFETQAQQDIISLEEPPLTTSHFPLFRLPREIRDQIYGLLLVERHDWGIHEGFRYPFPKALLLANRQFHDEVAKAFYEANVLRLEISYDWRLPEKLMNSYRQYSVRFLEIEIRIDTQNPETDYEHLAPFYAPFPSLPALFAGVRRNLLAACEVLATGSRLRYFKLEWWDKQEHGAWSAKRVVLEPLTLLRGVGEVHIDREWDLFKFDNAEHPGGNTTKDGDFDWLKMVMEQEGGEGGMLTFDYRDSKTTLPDLGVHA